VETLSVVWRFYKHRIFAIPVQAWKVLRVSRWLGLPDLKTISPWRWTGCRPYVPAAFTPRRYSWYFASWVYWRAKMCLKELCQWKLPMAPSGIEPVTFQLVAQCLNQLCHPVPRQTHITQFTYASTQYVTNICDTRFELHYSKHRTNNESLEKWP
jgi:hypothetical protein